MQTCPNGIKNESASCPQLKQRISAAPDCG
jgi:hypothetical protein